MYNLDKHHINNSYQGAEKFNALSKYTMFIHICQDLNMAAHLLFQLTHDFFL